MMKRDIIRRTGLAKTKYHFIDIRVHRQNEKVIAFYVTRCGIKIFPQSTVEITTDLSTMYSPENGCMRCKFLDRKDGGE